mgnify:CR=1 FL=1
MREILGESPHIPVFGREVCEWLISEQPITILDCTVGYGGHAELLLQSGPPGTKVIGLDRDSEAIEFCRRRLSRFGDHIVLRQGNHRDLKQHLAEMGIATVGGVLFDFGVSSPQLDNTARGFSFQQDGPLDMRMDQSIGRSAADVVNASSESALADIIYQFGEERYSRRIARAIVEARTQRIIGTTRELAAVVEHAVPASYRHGRIHCATRTFQALRIAVNRELDVLEPALRAAVDLVAAGGRVCAVSFHSLEDRIVKHTFRALANGPEAAVRVLTKKPVIASESERDHNPRSRSAKLRVVERLSKESMQ